MKLGRVVRVLYDDSRKEIFSADKENLCGINEEYTNILKNSRYIDLTLLDS